MITKIHGDKKSHRSADRRQRPDLVREDSSINGRLTEYFGRTLARSSPWPPSTG